MTLHEALDQPFETYMGWCRAFVERRAQQEPITAILLSYPFALTALEASWARRYWYHKNGSNS